MVSFLLGILPTIWPYLVAGIGGLAALFFASRSGVKSERAKADRARLRAAQERLEMDREATAAEREAARLSDEEARKEALKWAKR